MIGLDPKAQPKFASVKKCILRPVLGDLNDWNIVTLKERESRESETRKQQIREMNEIKRDILEQAVAKEEHAVEKGGFGCVRVKCTPVAPEGYRFVQWVGQPGPLQSPRKLELCGNHPMPAGTMAVKCNYWMPVKDHAGWHQPPYQSDNEPPNVRIHWSRNVLRGALEVSEFEPPPLDALFKFNQTERSRAKCFHVRDLDVQKIDLARTVRDRMEVVQIQGEHFFHVVESKKDPTAV